MGRLGLLLGGVILGAASMFLSMKYHVVRAEDGMHLIPKVTREFSIPYVDIRNFDLSDWDKHRELALAIVQADKSHLLQAAAAGDLLRSMEGVLNNLRSPRAN